MKGAVTDSLYILTFHAIDERRSIASMPPRVFRRAVEMLREAGARTLALSDLLECLRSGDPFPPRSIVITFDDGYRSLYEVAFPLLQRHGLSATVFLTVGDGQTSRSLPSLEGRAMLSWSEIREMQGHGIVFGAHTCTHPDLTLLPTDRAEVEVLRSKTILEQALGDPVRHFAYPYGRYDDRIRDIVRSHFQSACSDVLGRVTRRSDPYGLERLDTYYLRNERLLDLTRSRLFPWYLRLRAIPRRVRRAVATASR